jgi:hypothetical protein
MRHYTPDTPPADRSVNAERTPLLRAWRSTSPASVHLVEQLALFWLDDDRRELERLVPVRRRWAIESVDADSVD